MEILTREQMYFLDKYTIETLGIAGKFLMENAGYGSALSIERDFLTQKNKIAVFCGSGNNGGDGFVVARYLQEWGYSPVIFLTGTVDKMSAETRENYEKCRELNIRITELHSDFMDTKSNKGFKYSDLEIYLMKVDLVVDAIFGVGFKGKIRGWTAELIKVINNSQKPVVAIDIASGLDANSGYADKAIKAEKTYTMAAIKIGQLIDRGREVSGEIEVIDIGIPKWLFKKFPSDVFRVDQNNVKYPIRNRIAHKGSYGRVAIFAGSPGFSGAAIMAAKSALRAGAGLITLFHPAGMGNIFETQLLEVMTFALSIKDNTYDFDRISEKIENFDVILFGPGIGVSEQTKKLLIDILQYWNKPLVIDADGLNILAQNKEILASLKGKDALLTPHIGEFSRLIDSSIEDILLDRIGTLRDFQTKYKVKVLLKSATTIFLDDKNIWLDLSGNDGLATGGSGDVLSGIITSFIGQKSSLKDAALAGSFLLGKTAEKIAEKRKPASIIPSDIIENLFRIQ